MRSGGSQRQRAEVRVVEDVAAGVHAAVNEESRQPVVGVGALGALCRLLLLLRARQPDKCVGEVDARGHLGAARRDRRPLARLAVERVQVAERAVADAEAAENEQIREERHAAVCRARTRRPAAAARCFHALPDAALHVERPKVVEELPARQAAVQMESRAALQLLPRRRLAHSRRRTRRGLRVDVATAGGRQRDSDRQQQMPMSRRRPRRRRLALH